MEAFVESLTLERVLREEQHQEGQKNSRTLRAFAELHDERMSQLRAEIAAGRGPSPLSRLLETGRKLVLVTVNFDQSVETELGDGISPFVTETELASFPDYLGKYLEGTATRVPYVKLHGDIGAPDTIVANVDDTAAGLSAARITAIRTLRDVDALIRPWIYIGYSMRDQDVAIMLASPEFADRAVEWWVNPFIDPSIARFIHAHRAARWRYSVTERVITLTATDYFEQLADSITANSAVM